MRKQKKSVKGYDVMAEINSILASASIPVKRPTKKQMNWTQAKKKHPKLDPMADFDMDGVMNMLDCRPFNKKKQGMSHQYIQGAISSGKRVKTVKMSPETFLKETYKEGELYRKQNKNSAPQKDYETYKQGFIDNRKTVEHLKNKIKSKKENAAIGFLEYEDGLPTGHEGRHTAVAAQELGIKKIPVAVESYTVHDEPEVSKLPLHRKQLPSNNWKAYGESDEDYKDKAVHRRVDAIEQHEGEQPEVLEKIETQDETEDEETEETEEPEKEE